MFWFTRKFEGLGSCGRGHGRAWKETNGSKQRRSGVQLRTGGGLLTVFEVGHWDNKTIDADRNKAGDSSPRRAFDMDFSKAAPERAPRNSVSQMLKGHRRQIDESASDNEPPEAEDI